MVFRIAIFALALAGASAAAEEPRVFTLREPLRELVSLEEPVRRFHFSRCFRHDAKGTLLLPAVATLRGYRAHPACEAPPVRYREVVVRQAPNDPRHTDERFRSWAGTTILLAPVGSAWSRARTARPGLDLYDTGGNHPTLAGTYLAAAVIYAAITGRSPEGLPHAFAREHASDPRDSLAASDASFLQEIAARATR